MYSLNKDEERNNRFKQHATDDDCSSSVCYRHLYKYISFCFLNLNEREIKNIKFD